MRAQIAAGIAIVVAAAIALEMTTHVVQGVITPNEADVNHDGQVNSLDLLAVAQQLLQPIPTLTPTVTSSPTDTPTNTPTATHTPTGTPTPNPPVVAGCQIFPADNPWNQRIDGDDIQLDPYSDEYVASINVGAGPTATPTLRADFTTDPAHGIPYIIVPASEPFVPVVLGAFDDESDPGPYPIPLNAPIEGGGIVGDSHVVALQQGTCKLFELWHASAGASQWNADAGAVFDLLSNRLRTDGWISASASGLAVFPGLIREDEVASGEITHALAFTVPSVQNAYVHPATHMGPGVAANKTPNLPPYGARFRLKEDFDISGYTGQSRVILEALKKYGMYVTDQGTRWFLQGTSDPGWDMIDLAQLQTVPGSAFEAVDTGTIVRGYVCPGC